MCRWEIEECQPAENFSIYCHAEIILDYDTTCHPLTMDMPYVIAMSSRAYELDEPNLTLYGEPGLNSTFQNFLDTRPTTRISQWQSYFIVGTKSWLIYEEPDYKGNSTCLSPSEDVIDRGYGITLVMEGLDVMLLGSVRKTERNCPPEGSGGSKKIIPRLTILIGFLIVTLMIIYK